MIGLLRPERQRGVELLDDPAIDVAARLRSHEDLVRANLLFGGRRAALLALRPVFADLGARGTVATRRADEASLLDVGTGLADIPWRAREMARVRQLRLWTIGLDGAPALLAPVRRKVDAAVGGHALSLPFADASVDIVLCSQLLHHFDHEDGLHLIAELDRVARRRVVISDLRRSWIGAAAFWTASLLLRFHAITRHDGTMSVLRGFTEGELGGMVLTATGVQPAIRRRLGYRLTASWTPTTSAL